MLQIIVKMYVQEDKIKEFIELFKEMLDPTFQMEGCFKYNMYRDEIDPSLFIVLEQWETRDYFEDYLLSKHFDRVVSQMMEVLIKEIEINIMHKVA